jgi:hypothetical protein
MLSKDHIFCYGRGCLLSEKCMRTKIPKEEVHIFTDEPFRVIDNKFTCEMFYGELQESIMNQLNEIINGKDNTGGTEENGTQRTEETE